MGCCTSTDRQERPRQDFGSHRHQEAAGKQYRTPATTTSPALSEQERAERREKIAEATERRLREMERRGVSDQGLRDLKAARAAEQNGLSNTLEQQQNYRRMLD